jgi:hypothetical protein
MRAMSSLPKKKKVTPRRWVSFTIPPEVYERVRAIAAADARPIASLARKLLLEFVSSTQEPA